MRAFYTNVSAEDQPQDMQIIRSTVEEGEQSIGVGYDLRRALASTICEKVLTKYNLNEVTVTVSGEGLNIEILPLTEASPGYGGGEDV